MNITVGKILIFLSVFTLLACEAGYAADQNHIVRLKGTPISFVYPAGMEDNTSNTYMSPARPFKSYERENPSPHGDAQFLTFFIEPVVETPHPHTLKEYVCNQLCGQDILQKPLPFTIDGHAGYEFAILQTGISGGGYIADMGDGAKSGLLPSAESKTAQFEIVFSDDGKLFHCVMTDDPDFYKKHVAAFERFCKSVKIIPKDKK